jgi:monofunctional biosynthetic peptidoglycan transglycosylase
MRTIVQFDESATSRWTVVNDDVMGGRSTSEMDVTSEATGLFTGFVSLENNGGFASTRADLGPLDLSAFRGVRVRVRGDGRRYQFRLRTDDSSDGVAYRALFDTRPGEWLEVELPFRAFEPSFRGRRPPGVGPLDPARVRQLGFLIADRKEGPFRLEVAWIKAYR